MHASEHPAAALLDLRVSMAESFGARPSVAGGPGMQMQTFGLSRPSVATTVNGSRSVSVASSAGVRESVNDVL